MRSDLVARTRSSIAPSAVVFVVALGARLVCAFHVLPASGLLEYNGGDGVGYHRLAVDITEGNWFSSPLFIVRPPGLPLLLAGAYSVFGADPVIFVGVSVLASSLLAVVAMHLALRLHFSTRRSVVVGIVVGLEPTLLFIGISPLADAVFALAVLLAVLFLATLRERPSSTLALTGLCLALVMAVLTKPSAILFWLIPVAALVASRRVPTAVVVGVVVLVPVIGWSARNYVRTDIPTYSTVTTYNLLFYRAAGVESRAEGKDYGRVVLPEIERELAERLDRSGAPRYTSYFAPTSSRAHSEQLAVALEILAEHPLHYLAAVPVGVQRLLLEPDSVHGALHGLARGWSILLVLVAVVRWWTVRRADAFFAWLVVAVVAYFAITTVVVITALGTRVAAPFLPLLVIVALWPTTRTTSSESTATTTC